MELTLTLFTKIAATALLLCLVRLLAGACEALVLKPRRLRSELRKQGIRGPATPFLVGNLVEMMRAVSQVPKAKQGEEGVAHNVSSFLFPALEKWTNEYGKIFMFSCGNLQYLHINEEEMVKEVIKCTSMDFGKASYQQKLLGPLLGQGILSSNGAIWSHKRKTLSPIFTLQSVNGMTDLMVESALTMVDTWRAEIESKGGVAEITVDEHLINFTTDVMSKTCFGRDNSNIGRDIFYNIKGLFDNMSKVMIYSGIPLIRYLPTKSNITTYKLENEVKRLILQAVQDRRQAATHHHDILQTILQGAENPSELRGESAERFIVDNFKNIYLAGYETAAVSAAWTLMLLAVNPEWQDRARNEVLEICGGRNPNNDAVRKMKTLKMVLHESLRLYPPVAQLVREALQDLKLGDITVPKGFHTWVTVAKLHQDPDVWGPDAHEFNPQRFANGVSGACEHAYAFMPFGVGPRSCLGQNFAMAEMKILFALILSNFSFSLSPNYNHSPIQTMVLKPEHGVSLLINKL